MAMKVRVALDKTTQLRLGDLVGIVQNQPFCAYIEGAIPVHRDTCSAWARNLNHRDIIPGAVKCWPLGYRCSGVH